MKLVWRILLLYHPMTMYMWLNSFLQLTKAERGISYCFHICASHSDVGKYRLYILAFMFNLLGIDIKYHGPDIKEVSDSIFTCEKTYTSVLTLWWMSTTSWHGNPENIWTYWVPYTKLHYVSYLARATIKPFHNSTSQIDTMNKNSKGACTCA